MTNKIIYESNALVGTNKAGNLRSDANGYYELVLGAYDFDNAHGDHYPLAPLKRLLEKSSALMRRINGGKVRSELGHPRKEPGMSDREFLMRVVDIYEQKVCAHIKRIELDEERVIYDGNKVAAVIGWVKPSGPFGDVLEMQLQNKDENVDFSVRSLTNDHFTPAGKRIKEVEEIITWDQVNEGGIVVANKYMSPALESHSFNMSTIREVADLARKDGMGMESVNLILSTLTNKHTVEPIRRQDERIGKLPLSSRWR